MVNYDLISQREWKKFLSELTPGKYYISMPNIKAIKDCKAKGYELNSDPSQPHTYGFEASKKHRTITISVTKRGKE